MFFSLSSGFFTLLTHLLILSPITIRYYLVFLGLLARVMHALNLEDELIIIIKSKSDKNNSTFNDTCPESWCMHSSIQLRNQCLFQFSKNQHLKHLAIERIILNHLVDLPKLITLWLLWYFLHLMQHVKQHVKTPFQGFLFFVQIIKILTSACLDCTLDLIDNLGKCIQC